MVLVGRFQSCDVDYFNLFMVNVKIAKEICIERILFIIILWDSNNKVSIAVSSRVYQSEKAAQAFTHKQKHTCSY